MIKKLTKEFTFYSLILTLFLSIPYAHAEQLSSVEKLPVTLNASKILPSDLLKGANFSVDDVVTNNGFFNIYSMHTHTGTIFIESTALLTVRVQEQKALQGMKQIKKTDTFIEGLKKSAMAPVNTVKGLVTEPVTTVSNIGSGIGSWFSDVKRSVVSDDPHQDNALKTAFGYSAIKRKYAYEFDIDPYTTNNVVQDELSNISQAAFAGGILPTVAFKAIDGGVGTVLSLSSTADSMKKLIRDSSPAKLEEINTKKLQKMGVPDYLIKGFLANRHYTPYDETLLVGELETMANVIDRKVLIAEAAMADSSDVAFYLRMKSDMMAAYNKNISKIERIEQLDGKTAVAVKQDGTVVVLTLADYVASSNLLWNKENNVSEAIGKIKGVSGKELWISGTFSPETRKNMKIKGWILVENASKKLRSAK